eukprot:scaffold69769_cov75-Phaeocystis_antarctica.AAC.2
MQTQGRVALQVAAHQGVRVGEYHTVRVQQQHVVPHVEQPRGVVVTQQPQPPHRVAAVEARRAGKAVLALCSVAGGRGRRAVRRRRQRGAVHGERAGQALVAARARAAWVGAERLRVALEKRAPHHARAGRAVPSHVLDQPRVVAEEHVVVQPERLELGHEVERKVELRPVGGEQYQLAVVVALGRELGQQVARRVDVSEERRKGARPRHSRPHPAPRWARR